MLELRDISFIYPHAGTGEVLSGVTLEVRAGEIVALLGPNGAGKSTLLAIANGSLTPQRGDVLFDGRPISTLSRREVAKRMALVAQPAEMRFALTALEYVLAGRYAHAGAIGFDSPNDVEIALRSLSVTDAGQFTERRFNQLSSGERQRVVLARALAQEPQLLLLDEPTANADIAHQISLLDLVRHLALSRNIGSLFVTHEINLAAEFADRVALLKDGRLVACGPPAEVVIPDLMSDVFETPLAVDTHPQSGKPRVTWIYSTNQVLRKRQ